MSKPYRFKDRDREVLAAVERLLKRLARSEAIQPAQLVSVAKVLHVLSRLPRVTEDVCVTIDLAYRTNYEHSSSSSVWHFFVGADMLALSCGGFEYTDGVGSDSFTTMTWEAQPGEQADYDGSWDDSWMERHGEDYSQTSLQVADFGGCEISVEDDDNSLLFENDNTEGTVDDSDSEPELEIYRRGEMIEFTREKWRGVLDIFLELGWQPMFAIERYLMPPWLVTHDEAKAMEQAGRSFGAMLDQNAALVEAAELDFALLQNLTRFFGSGAFIVGKPGAYEDATLNDFSD